MSDKEILLEKPMTWAGVNYAPGQNKMPDAAASYALKRNFGKSVSQSGTQSEMTSSVFPEDFPGFDVLGQIEDMTPEKLAEMPDQDVLKIKGIGRKRLKSFRAYGK